MNTHNISKYFFLIFSFLFLSTLSVSADEIEGIDQEPTNIVEMEPTGAVEQEPTDTINLTEQKPLEENEIQPNTTQINEEVDTPAPVSVEPTINQQEQSQSIILHINEVTPEEAFVPVEPKREYVTIDTNGIYRIQNIINKNYVIDLSGGKTANGTNIQLYTNNDSNVQLWKINLTNDGFYQFMHMGSGKVLELQGSTVKNGINIRLWDSNNGKNQKFKIEKFGNGYRIVSALDDAFVLDVSGGKVGNGKNIQIYKNNGTNAQIFTFDKIYSFLNEAEVKKLSNKKYLLRARSNTRLVLTKNEIKNIQYEVEQVWTIQHVSGNFVSILNPLSKYENNPRGYTLIENGTSKSALGLSTSNTAPNYQVLKDKNGYYVFLAKNKLTVLNREGDSYLNYRNFNHSNAQKWVLEEFKTAYQRGSVAESVLENLPRTLQIRSYSNSNFVLDVQNAGYKNCVNVQIWKNAKAPQQAFEMRFNEFGYVTFTNINSGRCLDISGWAIKNAANIQQYNDNYTGNQKWILVKSGNGYALRSAMNTNYSLAIACGKNANGTNVILYKNTNNNDQRFTFVSYAIPKHNAKSVIMIRPTLHQPKKSTFGSYYNDAMRIYLSLKKDKKNVSITNTKLLTNNTTLNTFTNNLKKEVFNDSKLGDIKFTKSKDNKSAYLGANIATNYDIQLSIADTLYSIVGKGITETKAFDKLAAYLYKNTSYSKKNNYIYDAKKLISAKHGVCQAYGDYLLNAMKLYRIDSQRINWTNPINKTSPNHTYNRVKLNGTWYYVDFSYMCLYKKDKKSCWFNKNDFAIYKKKYKTRTVIN